MMTTVFRRLLLGAALLAPALIASGCKQEATPAPRAPGSTPSKAPAQTTPTSTPALPPDHPPISSAPTTPSTTAAPEQMEEVDTSDVTFTDTQLTLTGISAPIPAGWISESPGMNSQAPGMSRKAQFRLPKADNEAEDAVVAVTHFPGMKGMNDANIQRWFAMFTQPDGRPTAERATKASYQLGQVTVTLVDITGSMQRGQRIASGGAMMDDHRILAAIVDHPKGPHFIKVSGPTEVIERWKPSVVAALKRFKVNP